MSLYSVVVPVYNSEHTLDELYGRLRKVFDETMKEHFELILVDDSSRDNSYEKMQMLHQKDPRVKWLRISVSTPHCFVVSNTQQEIMLSLWMMIFSTPRKRYRNWLL